MKVRINGRDGIIAGGGKATGNLALNSLEFFDLRTAQWYSLGRMKQARRFPSLSIINGKLVVTGNIKHQLYVPYKYFSFCVR